MKKICSLTFFLLVFISVKGQNLNEHWRPDFHFSPEKNWTNDPNGLIFLDGEYHLFYQFNPFENKWGHMSWGHAISKDLIKWEHLPVAIPEDSVWIFSGSTVIDKNNSSGLGNGNGNCMVAIYTADYHNGKKEAQYLAYSNDKGRTWEKYAGNPVLDLNAKDFRDPNVFWYEKTKQWIMSVVLPTEYKVLFYGSSNLKNWNKLGEFGNQGDVRKIWECPSLTELAVDGDSTKTKWLLMVSSNGPEQDFAGVQYFIGDFDGKSFKNDNTPDTKLYVDYGKDFYASIPWNHTPQNQKLMLGWMLNWKYAENQPTFPWKGQMSVPRQMALKTFPEGVRLTQLPVEQFTPADSYRFFEKKDFVHTKEKLLNGSTLFAKNAYIIEADLTIKSSRDFGFKIAQNLNKEGKATQETIVGYDVKKQQLYLDRTNSGKIISPDFASVDKAFLKIDNKRLRLKIVVDKMSVEVFANDGAVAITSLIFTDPKATAFSLFCKKGKIKVNSLKIWDLSKK